MKAQENKKFVQEDFNERHTVHDLLELFEGDKRLFALDLSDDYKYGSSDRKTTAKFIVEASEDGVLTFSYPGEDYSIRIFPVRNDLLDTKAFPCARDSSQSRANLTKNLIFGEKVHLFSFIARADCHL